MSWRYQGIANYLRENFSTAETEKSTDKNYVYIGASDNRINRCKEESDFFFATFTSSVPHLTKSIQVSNH
jgi:hypothetical protein